MNFKAMWGDFKNQSRDEIGRSLLSILSVGSVFFIWLFILGFFAPLKTRVLITKLPLVGKWLTHIWWYTFPGQLVMYTIILSGITIGLYRLNKLWRYDPA